MAELYEKYNNPNTCVRTILAAVLPPLSVIQFTVPLVAESVFYSYEMALPSSSLTPNSYIFLLYICCLVLSTIGHETYVCVKKLEEVIERLRWTYKKKTYARALFYFKNCFVIFIGSLCRLILSQCNSNPYTP